MSKGLPADSLWLPLTSLERFANKFLLSPRIGRLTDQNNGHAVDQFFRRLPTPADVDQTLNEIPVNLKNTWLAIQPTNEFEIRNTDQSAVKSWPLSRYKRDTTQPSQSSDYIPSLPSGVPSPSGIPGASTPSSGGSSSTATLIIGGFNALLVPVSGITPSNMAGFMQTAEQLGNSHPVKPFKSEP